MAEYMEREVAIKAIYDSDPNGIRRTLGFNVGQIEEALRAVPAVSVPQWISVKDRLPENKTRNIVLRYDHVTKTHFVDILWFCGNGWFCNPLGSGAEDKSISCWMPLPKPPKGENDG